MRTLIKLAVGAIAALAALFVIGMFVGILGAAFSAGGTSSNVGGDGGGQAQQEPAQRPEPEPSAQATKPQEPEDYLHVTGTPGIPFSCSIMHGDMRQTTVDGTVPQKIKLEDMGFGAMSELAF